MLRRICRLWLRLGGYDDQVSIEWEDINLRTSWKRPGPAAPRPGRRDWEGSKLNITKTALALQQAEGVSPEELELINTWSKKPLTAQEVYVFSVRLCDNDIDRDGERFAVETWRSWGSCLWGCPGCSTISGPPGDRPPASTQLTRKS